MDYIDQLNEDLGNASPKEKPLPTPIVGEPKPSETTQQKAYEEENALEADFLGREAEH